LSPSFTLSKYIVLMIFCLHLLVINLVKLNSFEHCQDSLIDFYLSVWIRSLVTIVAVSSVCLYAFGFIDINIFSTLSLGW
jgi:hypothetical protein